MSVLGKYSHITGKIALNSRYQHSPEYLVSTLAHELHHQWQHESWGIKYILLANFFTRDKYIERTAREVEQYIDGFIGMEGMRDGDK